MDAVTTNLPLQLTSFIGREREIAEVRRLLGATRLLTLTGAGGSGKTRLALQVATDLAGEYADGAWFVDLAPLADPALVPQAVASALGVTERPGHALADALSDFLRAKHILLVLDNCEHLRDACARIAQDLLTICPDLQILATSREDLDSSGEVTWLVPPLSLPEPDQMIPVEKLMQSEAIRLFVERAQAAQSTPPFALTNQNAALLAQICRRLDGMPLAIELAAARVKVLTVAQIAARLDNAFQLLTRGSAALPRQQTLRATITWSHDLLSEQERALFRRLAVFAGGFTLEQIESVCAGEMIDAGQVLDLLSELIDKSLVVVAERHATEARYRLLETIRVYGLEKLQQSGEAEAVRNRHRDWFLAFTEKATPAVRRSDQVAWLNRLEAEHDNLRTALEWAVTHHDLTNAQAALRFVAALESFWRIRDYFSEGRQWLDRALQAAGDSVCTIERAGALLGVGRIAFLQGDSVAARSYLNESLVIARESSDTRLAAYALDFLGVVAWGERDLATAQSCFDESLPLFQRSGDQWGIAEAYFHQGFVPSVKGNYATARPFYQKSLALFRELGDKARCCLLLRAWGSDAFHGGDYASAWSMFEEALAVWREIGTQFEIVSTLESLGQVARCQGENARAIALYEESVTVCRERGLGNDAAWPLVHLGFIYLKDGDYQQAKVFFEESLNLFRKQWRKLGAILCLAGFAGILQATGKHQQSARLLGATEEIIRSANYLLDPADRTDYDYVVAAVRSQLDQATFQAALAEGRAMILRQGSGQALEQAIEYALAEQVAVPPPTVAPPHDPNALTPREIEVLRWVAAGLSNAQVAGELVISPRTVNTHLSSIYSKLGVNSRSAATRYALGHKLT